MPDWAVDLAFTTLALSMFVHASIVVAYAHHHGPALMIAAFTGYSASFMAMAKVVLGSTTAQGVLAFLVGVYLSAVVKSLLNDRRIDA
jgi:hypothetical protein